MARSKKPKMIEIDGVQIPEKVGHGYTPLWVKPLSSVWEPWASRHRRIHVFHFKGVVCAVKDCKRQGYYVIAGRDRSGGVHIDLYTKDFVLMTVDHIHPRSKGGSDELYNKQPMCEPCNTKKGAKLPHELVTLPKATVT